MALAPAWGTFRPPKGGPIEALLVDADFFPARGNLPPSKGLDGLRGERAARTGLPPLLVPRHAAVVTVVGSVLPRGRRRHGPVAVGAAEDPAEQVGRVVTTRPGAPQQRLAPPLDAEITGPPCVPFPVQLTGFPVQRARFPVQSAA